MAVQTTLFGNHFQAAVEVSGDWHIKQLAVLAFSAIFLNDAQGYVQQFDMALRLGLLTCDVNPLATVLLRNPDLPEQRRADRKYQQDDGAFLHPHHANLCGNHQPKGEP